ncbi:MAG: NAD(P)H-hydrate dehydratase [Anaerolineae bacterium]|nr:NAD(P)H-hydrate dehydratase [Anaerolineae bacterium]
MGDEDDTQEFLQELLAPFGVGHQKRVAGLGFRVQQEEGDGEGLTESKFAPLPPLVIDADGLNVLAKLENWPKLLPENTILTPHPVEFGRLTGLEREVIQADRVGLALRYAAEWSAVVVLKGAFTVIAAPDGRATVSPFASAALATAGTGDVLAGAIAGLLAQGIAPYEAAVAGVWLHGWAGTHEQPERGNIASDVVDNLAVALQVAMESGR